MAQSNHERVGKALDLLNQGLRPFVEREMRAVHGERWLEAAQQGSREERRGGKGKEEAPNWDTQALLAVMWDQWNLVFRNTLGQAERSLVLIDEWVAYVRQLYGKEGLPGGSFEANLTFAQALTEAARAVPQTLVVASIPASDIEIGGEGGKVALERLKNIFGRIESPWRPASAEETIKQRIPETYQWLLVPGQPDPHAPVEWEEIHLQGQDPLAVRAAKKLKNDGLLLPQFAGTLLRHELDRIPLWRGDHVGLKQLAEDFAQYLYLPRLKDPEVLRAAVQDGLGLLMWKQNSFAYADGWDAERRRYPGLRVGQMGNVILDGESLLVKPELAARAHRDNLARPRPVDQEFRKFWGDVEAIFNIVLDRLESRYLNYFRFLDDLLAQSSPTQENTKDLRLHVPNNLVTLGYFFDRLTIPAWLEPLKAQGFFGHPPEPDHDHERGTIRFPPWPESRYLARMAALEPDAVLEVALQIPDTENVRVHENLIDAALVMPADLAVRFVPKAKAWMESPYQLLLPEKVGALVVYLARGRQVDEALDLARALLTVLPDPRAEEEAWGNEAYRLPSEPRARFDIWDYEQILKVCIPHLVMPAGEGALMLLCDLLEDAVRFSRHHKGDEGTEDSSYIWRPAIEDHSQNDPYELRGLLVSAVRDAAEALIETKGRTILEIVERRPFKVFQRIGLHLRRVGSTPGSGPFRHFWIRNGGSDSMPSGKSSETFSIPISAFTRVQSGLVPRVQRAKRNSAQ